MDSSLEQFVSKGRIVWTMTTSGYTKYTLNLYSWLLSAKVPWKLCIICCDPESERFFRHQQIPYVSWKNRNQRSQDGMAAFGTPGFEKCNQQKLAILEWFARNYSAHGIEYSLYLDGDIVVRKDPWPLLLAEFEGQGPNLLFQCDCCNDIHEDRANCGTICSGVIACRHVAGQEALYTFDKDLWDLSSRQDQPFIAKRLQITGIPFKMLSRKDFGNGIWQKTGKWKNYDWCLLHYNYLVSSTKRTAMKAENHWLVPY